MGGTYAMSLVFDGTKVPVWIWKRDSRGCLVLWMHINDRRSNRPKYTGGQKHRASKVDWYLSVLQGR